MGWLQLFNVNCFAKPARGDSVFSVVKAASNFGALYNSSLKRNAHDCWLPLFPGSCAYDNLSVCCSRHQRRKRKVASRVASRRVARRPRQRAPRRSLRAAKSTRSTGRAPPGGQGSSDSIGDEGGGGDPPGPGGEDDDSPSHPLHGWPNAGAFCFCCPGARLFEKSPFVLPPLPNSGGRAGRTWSARKLGRCRLQQPSDHRSRQWPRWRSGWATPPEGD
jgi:hypothetical protein